MLSNLLSWVGQLVCDVCVEFNAQVHEHLESAMDSVVKWGQQHGAFAVAQGGWTLLLFQVWRLSLREIKWLTQGLFDSKEWIKNWDLDPLNVNPVPSVLAYHSVGMMF